MPNMKLLDLQTGKYLELGKDFLYGGVGILVSKIKLDFALPMYLFNAVKSDYDWLNNAQTQPVNISDIATFETIRGLIQEPLKTLCEQTGAVVYGGRYVLLHTRSQISIGDCIAMFERYTEENLTLETAEYPQIFSMLTKYGTYEESSNFGYLSEYGYVIGNAFNCSANNCEFIFDGNKVLNIFEEYSKQLRNEPNKFKELIKLVK